MPPHENRPTDHATAPASRAHTVSRRTALRLGAAGVSVPVAVSLLGTGTAGAAPAPTAPAPAPAPTASTPPVVPPAPLPRTATLTGAVAERAPRLPAAWQVKPFASTDVTLDDSVFATRRDRLARFLHDYPVDNMLFLFRRNAGIANPRGAHAPGVWEAEDCQLRGHYAGHFLSGLALQYAGTGDPAMKDRVDAMVAGLAECQQALDATVGRPARTGKPTWTTGHRGGSALGLDGTSTYVQLPSSLPTGLRACTLSVWVRPDTVTAWSRALDLGSGTSRYAFLAPAGGTGTPQFTISTGGTGGEQTVRSSKALTAGAWHHLAVTLGADGAVLYLDGAAVGSSSAVTLRPADLGATPNCWIGRSQFGDALYDGLVDDLDVFARALTATEVAAIAAAAPTAPTGDVAAYRFDEGRGTSLADSAGVAGPATVVCGTVRAAGPSHAGYLAAYPEQQFIDQEDLATYPTVWAPWYTNHMILRGLLDAHVHAGSDLALTVAAGMGAWAWSRLSKLGRDRLDAMWETYIAGEYNAMPAALADLYALTGDADHLAAAQCFVNTRMFEAAVVDEDVLAGEHANQHIPQYLGYAAMFDRFDTDHRPEDGRDPAQFLAAARHFWAQVVGHRTYVDGGMAGTGEIFGARDVIAATIGTDNAETCCVYNMLKLGRELFFHTADPTYVQYHERALYGQLLGSRQDVDSSDDPLVTYFLPVHPGSVRGYGNLGTCCGGTALETHAKFADSVYAVSTDDRTLYVNLRVASTLHWRARKVTVRQTTTAHDDPAGRSRLVLGGRSATFTMRLRVPYWSQQGFRVTVNGVAVPAPAAGAGYVDVTRSWQPGDVVETVAPYTMRVEAALDRPQTQAFAYGPLPLVTVDDDTDYLDLTFAGRLGLSGDAGAVMTTTASPSTFTLDGRLVRPLAVTDQAAYHLYFHRVEPTVVFGGRDSGQPNVAGPDGRTLLDGVWAAAPFTDRAAFVRTVTTVARRFVKGGLMTQAAADAVVDCAHRAPMRP